MLKSNNNQFDDLVIENGFDVLRYEQEDRVRLKTKLMLRNLNEFNG